MSRAFTKEDDAGEDLPELPVPEGPNYVTPRGLELLKKAGKDLVARREREKAGGNDVARLDRDLRYLEARINAAIVVPPGSGAEIRFGARVTLEQEGGQPQTYRIVGTDEARSDASRLLNWSSPLALALMGAKAGDTVSWEGPETVNRARVLSVEWPAD
jgi:transcription elongation GreA/GreB family factor